MSLHTIKGVLAPDTLKSPLWVNIQSKNVPVVIMVNEIAHCVTSGQIDHFSSAVNCVGHSTMSRNIISSVEK